MKTFVFNGWAADPATWDLTTFPRERVFGYIEELEGVPASVLDAEDEYVLVGFSMGGTFALQEAMRRPGKMRGLVLVSSTARMMESPSENWAGMSLRRRKALMLGTQMMHPDDPSPIYDAEWMQRGLDYLEATDIRDALVRAVAASERLRTMPVAILQAERDGIVRPANALFLKSVFPQATVTMLHSGEHVLPLFHPEETDAAVRAVQTAAAGPEIML